MHHRECSKSFWPIMSLLVFVLMLQLCRSDDDDAKSVLSIYLSALWIYWELISLIQVMIIIDLWPDSSQLLNWILMHFNYQCDAFSFFMWLIETNHRDSDGLPGELENLMGVIHTAAHFPSPFALFIQIKVLSDKWQNDWLVGLCSGEVDWLINQIHR